MALHWVVVLAVGACIGLGSGWDTADAGGWSWVLFLAIGGWVWLGTVNARVVRQMYQLTVLLEQDPQAAEARLACSIRQRFLHRSVRLLLYHRLAMLRYRQRRYPETALICRAVLQQRFGHRGRGGWWGDKVWRVHQEQGAGGAVAGAGGRMRVHLLLMLVDANLHTGDTAGAYGALVGLHRQRLSLVERMRLLVLQIRYEVMVGRVQVALRGVNRKIRLAEVMPSAQGGTVHAMLAVAAARARKNDLAEWLRCRAELLCTPQQVRTLAGLGAGVVPWLNRVSAAPGPPAPRPPAPRPPAP